ncbi:unnamed protein product [Heterobilharzia americana]|nr:unnamed protein product [Heterobilharzia americana]
MLISESSSILTTSLYIPVDILVYYVNRHDYKYSPNEEMWTIKLQVCSSSHFESRFILVHQRTNLSVSYSSVLESRG